MRGLPLVRAWAGGSRLADADFQRMLALLSSRQVWCGWRAVLLGRAATSTLNQLMHGSLAVQVDVRFGAMQAPACFRFGRTAVLSVAVKRGVYMLHHSHVCCGFV